MASEFGWYCIDHRMFMEDHDAVNDHIEAWTPVVPHHITGCARITDGDEFPPDSAAPILFP